MNLYHIARRIDWERSRESGWYRGDTLETEGFIHFSTRDQILRVANAFYRGQVGLVLLEIDPSRLASEVRWEVSPDGERFPHLYGPLNREAVTQVDDFHTQPDGSFRFPS